jgi:hypothetical protein
MLSRHEVEMSDIKIQGGSNMTGTDLCVNVSNQSRSYLDHLVHTEISRHIIQFLSHWIRGSVYENNLRARFHVPTKHICIGPYLCCPYTCLYIYH